MNTFSYISYDCHDNHFRAWWGRLARIDKFVFCNRTRDRETIIITILILKMIIYIITAGGTITITFTGLDASALTPEGQTVLQQQVKDEIVAHWAWVAWRRNLA